MTYKDKMEKEGVVQAFDNGSYFPESVQIVEGKYRLFSFVIPVMYSMFRQEDYVQLHYSGIIYKLLVVKIEHKGDCIFVRSLIRGERKAGDEDALGR